MGGETLVCKLGFYDVYTSIYKGSSESKTDIHQKEQKQRQRQLRKAQPSPFCFAIRSTQNSKIFENKDDYIHYLCAPSAERLVDWVLALRLAKVCKKRKV